MRLNIRLIDDINTQFIGEFQQKRIRRIVGGADRVDVVLLAQLHIPHDLRGSHRIAGVGRGIVMIDSLELQQMTVQLKELSLNADAPEANLRADRAAFGFKQQFIKNGIFGVPFHGFKVPEADNT